MSEHLVYF